MCKIAGTEFLWYQANRALQLAGGEGYMRTERYEKILRDIRIFPIFEGANDVLRSYVALNGLKPVGEKLSGLGNIGLGDPIGSLGVLADYVGARIRPDKITMAPSERCSATPTPSPIRSSACARSPRSCSASTAGDRPQGPSPPPPVRRARRHLRPDRGDLPRDRAVRRAGRRDLGPGAAHRAQLPASAPSAA